MTKKTKVRFDLGGTPVAGEIIWAESIARNLYRLLNIPFYAEGYAINDIVHCQKNGDWIEVVDLAQDSGNGTIRIYFENPQEGKVEQILDEFTSLGCEFERASATLVAISIPYNVEVPFSQIANYLNSLSDDKVLSWEIGKRINRDAPTLG